MKDKSLSEKALDYMQGIYDRKSDYFQNKSNRKEARQSFIDLYKLDQKKGSDIFNHAFPKFLRKNKLNRKEFLDTRCVKPKNLDMKAIIRPKPQSFAPDKSPVEAINEEIQHELVLQEVQGHPQIKNEHIKAETVESAFEGFCTLLKLRWPLNDLTSEEKETLGRMWLPAFCRYLTENWTIIGLPLLVTIGIFGKHFIKARRIKKENQLKAIEEKKEVSE